jgi:hypothetical protein
MRAVFVAAWVMTPRVIRLDAAPYRDCLSFAPATRCKPLGFIRSIVLAAKREIEISSGSSAD